MDRRKLACILAAGFSVTLVSAATSASASPRDVFVTGKKFDTEFRRKVVSYTDLNLALTPDQKVLGRRISDAAFAVCSDFNGAIEIYGSCPKDAIRSTDDQVAAAIDRAERQMAGLPVGPAVAISMAVSAG